MHVRMTHETETEIGIDIERTRRGFVARSLDMRELSVRADNRQRLLRDVPEAAAAVARRNAAASGAALLSVAADWRFPVDGSGPRIVLRVKSEPSD